MSRGGPTLGQRLAEQIRSSIIAGSAEVSRLTQHFDELPLPLSEWLASPVHMDLADEPLSKIQYGVLRHAEQIYFPDLYSDLALENLKWRPVRYVNSLWMMVGKGGGKDRIAALTQLRVAYLLMCLRKPSRYMGIGATSKIHMLNTATSEGQGENIFFAELTGLLNHSPWFQGKYEKVSREIRYDKGIVAISGNSKEEAHEGLNLLLGVLDEIDAFRTKEEREKTARTQRGAMLNADGIYDMMRTSGSSRFPVNYKVLGLSWPRYIGSFIWNKYDEGLADNEVNGNTSRIYVTKATTWESNPTKDRNMYLLDYRDDPELSKARYECMPPESEDPYFKNKTAIKQNLRAPFPLDPYGRPEPPLKTYYRYGLPTETDLEYTALGDFQRRMGVAPKEGWQLDMMWGEWFTCNDTYPRAVHVDTGIRHDRTGLAMAHVRDWSSEMVPHYDEEKGEWEDVEQRRPLVTVDFVLALEAPKPDLAAGYPRGEVELRWIRRIIFELVGRGFPIQRVTFDGYQSTDSIQLLNAAGMEAELFSLDRNLEGYSTAKSVLYTGGLMCHAHPLLEKELLALTIINGKKVDHPPNGSKDVADAWAGAITGAVILNEAGGDMRDVWLPNMPSTREHALGISKPSASAGMLAPVPDDLSEMAGMFRGSPVEVLPPQ